MSLKTAWNAIVLFAALVAITATSAARADTPVEFLKGTEFYTLRGGYQNQRQGENQYVAHLTPSFGHYFLDNAAVEVQVPLYYTHDDENAVGIGVNALARYHFINWGSVSLYGDVLGGIMFTSNDFPTGGTPINGTYAGGPGLSFRLREGLRLDTGLRFEHISNGFYAGRDKNPIFNSYGGYIGIMWTK